jgi:superfamily II DNA/RNA helicase
MAESHLTELSFSSLHLPGSLQKGLADASFERCTPIQAQTLPQALAGLDVAGQAQTGTGKTAAFLVAMYARLIRSEPLPSRNLNAPRALIIAPTRELAVQIHRDAEVLGSHTGLKLGLAFWVRPEGPESFVVCGAWLSTLCGFSGSLSSGSAIPSPSRSGSSGPQEWMIVRSGSVAPQPR